MEWNEAEWNDFHPDAPRPWIGISEEMRPKTGVRGCTFRHPAPLRGRLQPKLAKHSQTGLFSSSSAIFFVHSIFV